MTAGMTMKLVTGDRSSDFASDMKNGSQSQSTGGVTSGTMSPVGFKLFYIFFCASFFRSNSLFTRSTSDTSDKYIYKRNIKGLGCHRENQVRSWLLDQLVTSPNRVFNENSILEKPAW